MYSLLLVANIAPKFNISNVQHSIFKSTWMFVYKLQILNSYNTQYVFTCINH